MGWEKLKSEEKKKRIVACIQHTYNILCDSRHQTTWFESIFSKSIFFYFFFYSLLTRAHVYGGYIYSCTKSNSQSNNKKLRQPANEKNWVDKKGGKRKHSWWKMVKYGSTFNTDFALSAVCTLEQINTHHPTSSCRHTHRTEIACTMYI